MERTHSQPRRRAAVPSWAHTRDADSINLVPTVTQSRFEFITVRDEGGRKRRSDYSREKPRPSVIDSSMAEKWKASIAVTGGASASANLRIVLTFYTFPRLASAQKGRPRFRTFNGVQGLRWRSAQINKLGRTEWPIVQFQQRT